MSINDFLNINLDKIRKKAKEKEEIKEIIENKVASIRKFLRTKLEIDLEDLIKKRKWVESSVCINLLRNSLTNKNKEYLKNKLSKLKYLKDKRPTVLYALDIILAWIIEDACIILLSKEPELECTQNENINREFLQKPKVIYDINLQFNSIIIPLEIKHDFDGYWKDYGTIELRDNSYKYFSKYHTIIFGIDFEYKQILMINTPTTNRTEYIEHHPPFGGKPATRIFINNKANFCNWNNWKTKLINNLKERSKILKENV